jgi:saccharopine dehydrogenase (NAD+, L-lysine-forming)
VLNIDAALRTDIVVVGGYGHVGGSISAQLAEKFPGRVVAAGRSLERAEQFCLSHGGAIRPLRISADERPDMALLAEARLVVMCLDQTNTAFAEACLRAGIHYVDVSANGSFLTALEELNRQEEGPRATAVLSVGLAPGLTNMLAKQAMLDLEQTRAIDVAIMLGLGDQHGKAAIEWTVDSLNADYDVMISGQQHVVSSMTDSRVTDFGKRLGRRSAYRFPFSDQQALPRTLGVPEASTRLCFDSRLSTRLLAALKRLGALKLLKRPRWRELAVAAFGKLRFGTEQFAVKVEASGEFDGAPAVAGYGISGVREAGFTADFAAAVAEALYAGGEWPEGVFHTEQLFDSALYEERIEISRSGAAAGDPVERSRAGRLAALKR